MEAILKKWGNSLACRIPSTIAKQCGLSDQSVVDISTSDGKIVISQVVTAPVFSLEELVSKITPDNKHDYHDTNFGAPVGREIL